jgi:hypothetical protein
MMFAPTVIEEAYALSAPHTSLADRPLRMVRHHSNLGEGFQTQVMGLVLF